MNIGSRRARPALLAALLVVSVLASYAPALRAGFVWDDDDYVTQNPLLVEPDGLRRIWLSTDAPSQYFPMVYTSFRLEYALWGLEPAGYHLVNILLHAACALLLWQLLARLGLPAAWWAAAIFALHPVHVESVAWVTERKNVLSCLFSLLAMLAWLRFSVEADAGGRRGGPRAYALALVFYAAALLSKTTACTLPAAQLAVLWLKGQRVSARRIAQVAPFLLLGVAMGVLSMWWERFHQGTSGQRFSLGLVESALVASRAVWFYLGKLVWPANLSFSYPKFAIDTADPAQYAWLLLSAALLCLLWSQRRRTGPGPLVAALTFVAALSPLLGFIPLFTFLYTYVADHYQYTASIGPIALFAAAASSLFARAGERLRKLEVPAALLLLLVLGTLTFRQAAVYENRETLWRDTVAKNPASWMAYTNLGRELMRQQRHPEAVDAYRAALAIDPDRHRPRRGLGQALVRLGRDDEARAHFERVVAQRPENVAGRKSLAALLWRQGELEAALPQLRAWVELAPNDPEGHIFLARALARGGRTEDAERHFRRALRLEPGNREARRGLRRLRPSDFPAGAAVSPPSPIPTPTPS